MNFNQMMNKLQNYKIAARPRWPSGQYLHLLQQTSLIYRSVTNNIQTPLYPYQLSVDDYNATDWFEVV